MKRILCLLLCLAAVLPLVACGGDRSDAPSTPTDTEETTETIPVSESETEVQTEPPLVPTAVIAEKIIYMLEGETYKLKYSVSETDGKPDGHGSQIIWTASSDAVSVKNGVVTARKDGYAVVSGGGESSCTVRVIPREMPVLSVTTEQPITSRDTYTPCLIGLDSTNEAYSFEKETAEIRFRGNSTYDIGKKKAYRIKFSSKRNLLGMNEDAECRSWVLLAEYFDHSMIRNSTCLSISSAIVKEYTSDWRYVRLQYNGMEMGVFLLAEQSQINEHRVAIEEAGKDTDDVESGYMMEIDQSENEWHPVTIECTDYFFETLWGEDFDSRTLRFKMENNNLNEAQIEYLQKFMRNSFEVVYRATYKNEFYELDKDHNLVKSKKKDAKSVISTVIDIDSLVRKYILDELVCTHDAYQKSYYMHVDFSENGTGLLTFSCPWDFDFSMYEWNETWSNYQYYDPEDFMQARRATWYVMIMNHEWFREMVTEYWKELYAQTRGFKQQLAMLQLITEQYAEDFAFDGDKWNRPTAQAEEARIALEWLTTRINWFNQTVGKGDYLTDTE